MASGNPWRPPPPYSDEPPRKRPCSPPESPSRNTRARNPIHRDVLYEQGPLPLFASFSSRGSRAISCFRNGVARIWNVDPASDRFLDCDHVLRHPETVFRAAVSDLGTRAVTTAGDGVARVWDLQNRQSRPKEIASQYRCTRTCDISSDGQFVAATFYTGKKQPVSMFRGLVLLYQPVADDYLFRQSLHGVPDKVKVALDATTIAVGCYGVKPARNMARDTRITLFDRDGTELRSFNNCFPNHDACMSWDLSDDGHMLAICAQQRQQINVYSDKSPNTWMDAPQQLRANAELTYEMCRIVDNGVLLTALALDNRTQERSVLVFRPCSGNVLFSLSCGLSDQRACLDLEPRVCYAAPTHDRPGRKVIRLLSRTPGEVSTVELMRCGDPPKNAFRGPGTEFGSISPYASLDNQKSDCPSSIARVVEDNPAPKLQKPMESSPAPASSQPVRTSSLPDDGTVMLKKTSANERVDDRSSPSQTFAGLSSPKNVSQAKPIPDIPAPDISMKDVQNSAKATPSESKQKSESQPSNISPKCVSKSLQSIEREVQPAEIVLTPKSTVLRSRELLRAKTERLSCKSSIASTSRLRATPSPEQAVTPDNANVSLTRQAVRAVVQKAPADSDAQALSDAQAVSGNDVPTSEQESDAHDLSDKQLTATEPATERKANERNNLLQTTAMKKGHDTIEEAKKTLSSTEAQKMDTDLEMSEVPAPNLRKPRWQPARIRARKKMLEMATLVSKAREVAAASTGQQYIKDEDLSLSGETNDEKRQATGLSEGTIGETYISNHSGPRKSPGDISTDGSKHLIQPNQPSEGVPASPGLERSPALGLQHTRASSSPRIPVSAYHPEVSIKTGDAPREEAGNHTFTPIITVSNLVASSYDRLMRTPECPVHKAINNETVRNRTPEGFKDEQVVKGRSGNHQSSPHITQGEIPRELNAKEETVFDRPSIKNSPTTMTSPSSAQLKSKEGSPSETKADPIEALWKNRYFETLERAKTIFREASHKGEGEQVLSNVRAFKAMLEVIRTESEEIDRTIVARIVYEKGGINNTLNENLFLEAFSHLYEEMQGVRQRQWAEVYNQAVVEEGEGLLVFHARDLIKRESNAFKTDLNPIWNDESLDEIIASQTADGVLVDQAAFVRSTEKIFSI